MDDAVSEPIYQTWNPTGRKAFRFRPKVADRGDRSSTWHCQLEGTRTLDGGFAVYSITAPCGKFTLDVRDYNQITFSAEIVSREDGRPYESGWPLGAKCRTCW